MGQLPSTKNNPRHYFHVLCGFRATTNCEFGTYMALKQSSDLPVEICPLIKFHLYHLLCGLGGCSMCCIIRQTSQHTPKEHLHLLKQCGHIWWWCKIQKKTQNTQRIKQIHPHQRNICISVVTCDGNTKKYLQNIFSVCSYMAINMTMIKLYKYYQHF